MDIAVLADIHSNYIALEHCMAYALERGIHTFIFLGDYISEMAYPERTMKLLYEYQKKYDCYFISGNKEKYWLNYRNNKEESWSEYNSTTGVLLYAYRRLKKKDLDFFESLPIAKNITFAGLPTLTVCHGSPRNVREQLIVDEALSKEILTVCETDYILCGHTHMQGKYTLHIPKAANSSLRLNAPTHERVILNPGSVGLALKSESSSQFMILHGEAGLAKRAPYWCQITAKLLRNHKNCPYGHAEVLERAMELCRLETGICN